MPSSLSRNADRDESDAFPVTSRPAPRVCLSDADYILANVLIRMWALASGRSLRRDVPPALLSVDELITFWADDMSPTAGRHAMPDGPDGPVSAQAVGLPSWGERAF